MVKSNIEIKFTIYLLSFMEIKFSVAYGSSLFYFLFYFISILLFLNNVAMGLNLIKGFNL